MTGFNRRFSPAVQRLRELLARPQRAARRRLPHERGLHPARPLGARARGRRPQHRRGLSRVRRVRRWSRRRRPRSRAQGDRDGEPALGRSTTTSSATLDMPTARSARSPIRRSAIAIIRRNGSSCLCGGFELVLDDYKSLSISGSKQRGWHSPTQQKGHLQELEALAACIRDGGPWPISLADQLTAMRTAFAVERELS